MGAGPAVERLSLNQITTEQWDMEEAIEGCVRAGIRWIGLWRHKVERAGLEETVQLLEGSDLKVSSLCRGGFFPAIDEEEFEANMVDNREAVDQAVALGTDVLVLVCGPAADRDIDRARAQIERGISELAPYAASKGVRLGIEPLHPMMAAERSALVTLAEANRIAGQFSPQQVGVVIDVYHLWWDPGVYEQIDEAAGRIVGFHVSDWLVPTTSILQGRGMMGEGVIELGRLRSAVESAGYYGPIEVEVINPEIWALDGDEVLDRVVESYRHVL